MSVSREGHAGRSVSIWMTPPLPLHTQPLSRDTACDVCIVGAGIAGMSTAYLLAQEGLDVVVLDDGPIGGGETERTTAHLSNALDDRYGELERLHGEEGARLAADSHTQAISRIETIVRAHAIDCDFSRVDGYLFAPPGHSAIIEGEYEAARRAGLVDLEIQTRAPIAGFDTGPCLRFGGQAQCHPLKYVAGLKAAIEAMHGRIFTETRARAVLGGERARIVTDGGPVVTAKAVVVATNTPVNDLFAIHTKQAAYRTFVIAAEVPRGSVPRALYWDTEDPYHYVRLEPGQGADVLIVGGEDHRTGIAADATERYQRLEQWSRARFAMMGRVRERWSGQVMEPVDGLAFIGANPLDAPNVYIATGDSGHGMTHGTIAGMILTDLIAGRDNRWAKLYDPSRKPLKAIGEFAKDALLTTAGYAGWLKPSEVASEDDVAPGAGAVARRGLRPVAAYRDAHGALHVCSAICPHLGGVVMWNKDEQSWDCPVHGSRFDAKGGVVNGPAPRDLTPLGEHDTRDPAPLSPQQRPRPA